MSVREYEVVVMTKVQETYSVMATSEAEALANWSDHELVQSECVEILDEWATAVSDE